MRAGARVLLILASLFLASAFCILLFSPFAIASNSGWSIDLFCQHGGVGENVASYPPFVVGNRIILFAYVTYNQAPVGGVLVTFQVNNPQSYPLLIATAQTNASGIATTNFTITENVYPSFPSSWESIATTSPAQQSVNDTMEFTVVEALTVTITPTFESIKIGNSVFFMSTVNGGLAPYYYQWYLNDSAVLGAENPSWTFTPTSIGTYYIYLNVTDNTGTTAKSNVAQVIVTQKPITPSVGGVSAPVNSFSFLAPWLSMISLLAAAMLLKGIIVRIARENKKI